MIHRDRSALHLNDRPVGALTDTIVEQRSLGREIAGVSKLYGRRTQTLAFGTVGARSTGGSIPETACVAGQAWMVKFFKVRAVHFASFGKPSQNRGDPGFPELPLGAPLILVVLAVAVSAACSDDPHEVANVGRRDHPPVSPDVLGADHQLLFQTFQCKLDGCRHTNIYQQARSLR